MQNHITAENPFAQITLDILCSKQDLFDKSLDEIYNQEIDKETQDLINQCVKTAILSNSKLNLSSIPQEHHELTQNYYKVIKEKFDYRMAQIENSYSKDGLTATKKAINEAIDEEKNRKKIKISQLAPKWEDTDTNELPQKN